MPQHVFNQHRLVAIIFISVVTGIVMVIRLFFWFFFLFFCFFVFFLGGGGGLRSGKRMYSFNQIIL